MSLVMVCPQTIEVVVVDREGIEPPASRLSAGCSTDELPVEGARYARAGGLLLLVRPLDTTGLSACGARVKPVKRLLQLGDRQRVLAAAEVTRLVVLKPLKRGSDHSLDEGTIRGQSIVASTKRAVLPIDPEADAINVPASRATVIVEIVDCGE